MTFSILLLVSLATVGQSDPTPIWDAVRLEREGQVVETQFVGGGGGGGGRPVVRCPEGWVEEGWNVLGAALFGDAPARRIAAVLGREDSLRVVGGAWTGDNEPPEWTVELTRRPPLDDSGAFLLGPGPGPFEPRAGFSPILTLGDSFLVMTGERGDLVLLDPNDGAIRTRLDAPWEIERGFIGPSVWSATLCRFGDEGLDGGARDEPALVDAGRAEFERRRTGWIVDRVRVGEDRVFLALAHATPGPWFRQRASGAILELDGSLRPMTLTELPEPVLPGMAVARDGGVVWPLATSGFARIDAAPDSVALGAGPNSHDRRGALRWITRPAGPGETACWRMDRARDTIWFHEDCVFRLPCGSWIPSARRNEIRMPFDRIELETGRSTRFEVVVPLDGEVGVPETNFRFDGTTYDIWGHRIASLTRIFHGVGGGLMLFFDAKGKNRVLVLPRSSLEPR